MAGRYVQWEPFGCLAGWLWTVARGDQEGRLLFESRQAASKRRKGTLCVVTEYERGKSVHADCAYHER